jgi:DNA-binding beta-propeller fold protein YncE
LKQKILNCFQKITNLFSGKHDAKIQVTETDLNAVKTFAGLGVRSVKVSSDGKYLFAAVNQGSDVQVFRAMDLVRISRIAVDSFPVGLALGANDSQLWVTSQGRNYKGGNSVSIFQVEIKERENISLSKDPRLNK